jgi:tetratricopeptide (TPR) repeat protein
MTDGGRPDAGRPRRRAQQPPRTSRPPRSRDTSRHDRSAARPPSDRGARSAPATPRGSGPPIPDSIQAGDLDPDVRRELRTLPKGLADEVARRLVAAGAALEEDPELAHAHAEVAGRIASRVAAVREALGLTAYATGRWAQARSELRAARRMSGSDDLLPVIADCERGLGHPERALEIAGTPEASRLPTAGRVEMRIVAAGARRDLGQDEAAVVTLQSRQLREDGQPWSARLQYAYADALLAVGRRDEALEWFQRAARNDPEGATEASERVDDLEGVTFIDDGEVPDRDGS